MHNYNKISVVQCSCMLQALLAEGPISCSSYIVVKVVAALFGNLVSEQWGRMVQIADVLEKWQILQDYFVIMYACAYMA